MDKAKMLERIEARLKIKASSFLVIRTPNAPVQMEIVTGRCMTKEQIGDKKPPPVYRGN